MIQSIHRSLMLHGGAVGANTDQHSRGGVLIAMTQLRAANDLRVKSR